MRIWADQYPDLPVRSRRELLDRARTPIFYSIGVLDLSSINGHGYGMTDKEFEREPGRTYRARTLKSQLSSRR